MCPNEPHRDRRSLYRLASRHRPLGIAGARARVCSRASPSSRTGRVRAGRCRLRRRSIRRPDSRTTGRCTGPTTSGPSTTRRASSSPTSTSPAVIAAVLTAPPSWRAEAAAVQAVLRQLLVQAPPEHQPAPHRRPQACNRLRAPPLCRHLRRPARLRLGIHPRRRRYRQPARVSRLPPQVLVSRAHRRPPPHRAAARAVDAVAQGRLIPVRRS